MQPIKTYCDKIEAILAKRKSSKVVKKAKGGLLSPSKEATTPADQTQINTIADIVEGIRDAREELLNGNK
jgi:hypothetical protein